MTTGAIAPYDQYAQAGAPIASGPGTTPMLIPYNPIIDLSRPNGGYYVQGPGAVDYIIITAATVFIPGDVAPDGNWVATVVADGNALHTLTTSGFVFSGDAFVPTITNRKYGVVAGYSAGIPYINFRDTGLNVDLVKPVVSTAAVADATPGVINCVTSKAMSPIFPAASSLAVPGHTVTGPPVFIDSTHFNIPVSPNFTFGEARQLAYTKPAVNPFKDQAVPPNQMDTFTGLNITNNLLSPFGRFTTLQTNLVESGAGPYSYTHTSPNAMAYGSGFNRKFPAGVAASLTLKCTAIGTTLNFGLICGFGTDNTSFNDKNTVILGVDGEGGGSASGNWYTCKNNAATLTASAVPQTVNTYTRIRRDAANVLYAELSPDGVTFTVVDSVAGANVDYWPKIAMQAASGVQSWTMQVFAFSGMV